VLGNIILEAHSLPAAAVRSPVPAHLIQDGVTGILVSSEDPGAMAAAFKKVIENPHFARRLGEAGKHQVQTVYGEKAVVAQYHALFEELLSRRCGFSNQIAA